MASRELPLDSVSNELMRFVKKQLLCYCSAEVLYDFGHSYNQYNTVITDPSVAQYLMTLLLLPSQFLSIDIFDPSVKTNLISIQFLILIISNDNERHRRCFRSSMEPWNMLENWELRGCGFDLGCRCDQTEKDWYVVKKPKALLAGAWMKNVSLFKLFLKAWIE